MDKLDVFKIENNKLNVFSSDFIQRIRSNCLTHKITFDEQFRIDIIARHLYGEHSNYWILLALNDIKDISQLSVGSIIYYPKDISLILNQRLGK